MDCRIVWAVGLIILMASVDGHGQSCNTPEQKTAAEQLVQLIRAADLKGSTESLLSLPFLKSAPEERRKQIAARLAEKLQVRWNAPDHLGKMIEFFCKNFTTEELGQLSTGQDSAALRKLAGLKENLKVETGEPGEKWALEVLREGQQEIEEFNQPDALLFVGAIQAGNLQWDDAGNSFQRLLTMEPQNPAAIESLGAALFYRDALNPERLKESLGLFKKLVQIEPAAPEGYYWIGVVDWTLAFNPLVKMRFEYNKGASQPIGDDDPLPPPLREEFASRYAAPVDEVIKHLQKALELAPNYWEAAYYLSYLFRLKANQVSDAEERQHYLSKADALVQVSAQHARKEAKRPERPLRPALPPPPPPPPSN